MWEERKEDVLGYLVVGEVLKYGLLEARTRRLFGCHTGRRLSLLSLSETEALQILAVVCQNIVPTYTGLPARK